MAAIGADFDWTKVSAKPALWMDRRVIATRAGAALSLADDFDPGSAARKVRLAEDAGERATRRRRSHRAAEH